MGHTMNMHDSPLTLLCGSDRYPVTWDAENSFSFSCPLDPGLYTFSLQADLHDFDWERTYINLTLFRNKGQRTGPWDFDLCDRHRPLLPTWRVVIDGRFVGMFYLQRPTIETVASSTLRGEFGFQVHSRHLVQIECKAYRSFKMTPLTTMLEPNALDSLIPQPFVSRGYKANWAHDFSARHGWTALLPVLASPEWQAFMRAGMELYLAPFRKPEPAAASFSPGALPVLALSHFCLNEPDALRFAETGIAHFLDLPAWGNPDPEGYSHNGDMGCAFTLKNLALAYVWFGRALKPDLRSALLARLVRQGETFFEQQLLMSQYWGGAIMQDHGFRSTASFGVTALSLLGYAPEASRWLEFIVPRLRRTLRSLPTDGFIPFSSYHKLQLYVNELTEFREMFRFASGEDIFDLPAFRNIPEYLCAALDADSHAILVCSNRGDRKPFYVGLPFLICLARDFGCPKAGFLAHHLMRSYAEIAATMKEPKDAGALMWAFDTLPFALMQYRAGLLVDTPPRQPALTHFPDGGLVNYRNAARRFQVSVGCYSPCGSFHALGTDLSSTDMIYSNMAHGHFSVSVAGRPLILNAESGYRTGSDLSSVLLIDGHGQYGDLGFPMGVSVASWRGQRILNCRVAADGTTGSARLNLQPAYPEETHLLTYTRDFTFEPERVTVRDTVVCRAPHRFAYRFHTYADHEVRPATATRYLISAGGNALTLELRGQGWTSRIAPTEVVWAYANEHDNREFQHIEFCLPEPASDLTVEFVIRLGDR